jgi:hypothetical protein
MNPNKISNLKPISVSDVGEYIRHSSCQRRFRLGYNQRKEFRALPFADNLIETLDPVLSEQGDKREEQWAAQLVAAGYTPLKSSKSYQMGSTFITMWSGLQHELGQLVAGQRVFAREVEIEAQLGLFTIHGRIDFLLIDWSGTQPVITIAECKASRRDKTYQRVQVVLYRMMLRELLKLSPATISDHLIKADDMRCCVVRIHESTNQMMTLEELTPVPAIEQIELDIEHLLASGGSLEQSLTAADVEELPYQLNSKCDSCVFGLHCFPESARRRRIELLGVPPKTVRTLQAAQIQTLDELADLDPAGEVARGISEEGLLSEPLAQLILRAKARRAKLPRDTAAEGQEVARDHQIYQLSTKNYGKLPEHVVGGQRLVRVFLTVHLDYAENRIGALAAHVTASEGRYHTGWLDVQGKPAPDPVPCEQTGSKAEETLAARALVGQSIVEIAPQLWTGDEAQDVALEGALLQRFFDQLTTVIRSQASGRAEAPLHFYVWSEREVKVLHEACMRVGPGALRYLRELFGCREGLEQLMYSDLGQEIHDRFALGWTGRSLAIAASLSWFGQRFHWSRLVNGTQVSLDRVLMRDLFDYNYNLKLDAQNNWSVTGPRSEQFEVRAHFYDQLTTPYLWAYWGELAKLKATMVSAGTLKPHIKRAFEAYEAGQDSALLETYLATRAEALRWLEERIGKNRTIEKPPLALAALPQFVLSTNDVSAAASDFLKLDHHTKYHNWLNSMLTPPILRVMAGRSLPLCEVRCVEKGMITAKIDTSQVSAEILSSRFTQREGSFVRIHMHSGDLHESQDYNATCYIGRTCRIKSIDWSTGVVELSVMVYSPKNNSSLFIIKSIGVKEGEPVFVWSPLYGREENRVFMHATLDDSVSDFVANQVNKWFSDEVAHPNPQRVLSWFHPEQPAIPPMPSLEETKRAQLESQLRSMRDERGGALMDMSRVEMILHGLSARIQLVQGPPGTGKTQLTAAAILTRISVMLKPGDIVFIGSHTHTAVNTLLERIHRLTPLVKAGLPALPALSLVKLTSIKPGEDNLDEPDDSIPEGAGALYNQPSLGQFQDFYRPDQVMIIGGTISALLKLSTKINSFKTLGKTLGMARLDTKLLVIDEASMMVGASFVALATLAHPDGQILLAGDNRQLSPIVAHGWDEEDRPPAQRFRLHESAFDAVANLGKSLQDPCRVRRDSINDSHRLPAEVVDVLKPLYTLDGIDLSSAKEGVTALAPLVSAPGSASLDAVWLEQRNVFLLLHQEQESSEVNTLEIELIKRLLEAGQRTGEMRDASVALITPHRAQRATLKRELESWGPDGQGYVTMMDTVERLQGGEQETIIFSATVSDPMTIAQRAEFILDLKRSNVAFSRPKRRLIVVCSQALLDHIPTEVKHYDAALLWKGLRGLCDYEVACGQEQGHSWRLLVRER